MDKLLSILYQWREERKSSCLILTIWETFSGTDWRWLRSKISLGSGGHFLSWSKHLNNTADPGNSEFPLSMIHNHMNFDRIINASFCEYFLCLNLEFLLYRKIGNFPPICPLSVSELSNISYWFFQFHKIESLDDLAACWTETDGPWITRVCGTHCRTCPGNLRRARCENKIINFRNPKLN